MHTKIFATAIVISMLVGCDSQPDTQTTTPQASETAPAKPAETKSTSAPGVDASAPSGSAEDRKKLFKAARNAACRPELARLCPGLRGDEARTCLRQKIDQVAPDCAKFYKPAP
jgi:hypothetical protein